MSLKNVLVTGAAGFIGFHLCKRLLSSDFNVIGIDSINDYYSPDLKLDRLKELGINDPVTDSETASGSFDNFTFIKSDISELQSMRSLFEQFKFDIVINLAAQAGVRYSIQNPHEYIESNVKGFLNLLECSKEHKAEHFIYASSSSVYGANRSMPFSTSDNIDHPMSVYAATKKANELLAHSYSNLFDLPTTGLRFFTVYGPWGRPDMAYFMFTKSILEGNEIKIFNNGDMARDFTYIDDIVESIFRLLDKIPEADAKWSGLDPDPARSFSPYRVFNIGSNNPTRLLDFVELLEDKIGQKASKKLLPMQPGDVKETWANVEDLYELIDFRPETELADGITKFVDWYKEYYQS